MRRTGKPIYTFLIVFLAALGFYGNAAGQAKPSVEATVSETTIYTGERIPLNITVSGDFSNVARPELPAFTDFDLLSDTPSTSRNISYTNGVTQSSYTYTYYLKATKKGAAQIPSITVTVDGQDYKTDPIKVTIVDRNTAAKSGNAGTQPDIYLKLEVSDHTPVPGQQLIANMILYFKDGLEVNSYQPVPGWKAEGFWKEALDNKRRPQVQSTVINGVRFRYASLLQFALFPTKTGKLTISPYKIRVSVRSMSSRNDPFSSFFGGFGTNQKQVDLESDPVTVRVHDLPTAPQGDYIGATGSFDIRRTLSTKQATVGQSIEITTTITGTGNIPLINKPAYDLPKGLEVYQPQEKTNINRNNSRISGTKIFTDVVIARTPGTFTLPEAHLAYFNAAHNKYETADLPAATFSVKRGANDVAGEGRPQELSLQPITGLAAWVPAGGITLGGLWWFWFALFFPLFCLGVAYWQKTYRTKMSTDRAFARSQKAADTAQQRLDDAITHSENGDIKGAYNALQKALTGFIGDRLGLPEAGLSIEQYVAALEEHNVNDELVKNVRMLLNKCATINYAPNASHEYLKSHVGLAESIIQKLKKEL